jgi:hypothetical protein
LDVAPHCSVTMLHCSCLVGRSNGTGQPASIIDLLRAICAAPTFVCRTPFNETDNTRMACYSVHQPMTHLWHNLLPTAYCGACRNQTLVAPSLAGRYNCRTSIRLSRRMPTPMITREGHSKTGAPDTVAGSQYQDPSFPVGKRRGPLAREGSKPEGRGSLLKGKTGKGKGNRLQEYVIWLRVMPHLGGSHLVN